MRDVRLAAAWTLAAVLAAPALLALAVPGVDFDAIRCAMKCGHAVKAGAVCCPTDDPGGVSWKTCPAGDPVLAGFVAAPPAILTLAVRLTRPSGASVLELESSGRPLSAFASLPDHVPLAHS
jgi:hypothetical protein